jgi:MFS family permease
MNRALWLLAACQGLYLTNNIVFIAINGLVGLSLAPYGWMATLPVMGYVIGGALSTGIVAQTQQRWGASGRSSPAWLVAILAALLCAYAAASRNFWLLCLATVVAGYYNANAGLYRFAAADLVGPAGREKAVSLVMAGGLLGAVIGPNLAALHARPAAGPVRRRLPGAGRGRAGVDGPDGFPALSAAGPKADQPGRAGRWRRSCASRCSSSPPRPAP